MSTSRPQRHTTDDYTGLAMSMALHLFAVLISLGLSHEEEPVQEEIIAVELVPLTALGEAPPPKQLPRIVASTPPPEASEEVSLSRAVEPKPKPKPEPKPKPKPKKRVSKSDLFSGFEKDDPRADRGPKRGDKRGDLEGTSTSFSGKIVSAYISRVSNQIRRSFKPPASLDQRQRSKMKTIISVKLEAVGQVSAYIKEESIKWVSKSGNKFFDDAALRAIKVFTAKGGAKLPLPKSELERKEVLRQGLVIELDGREM